MNDMTSVIAPRSDQLNNDDLLTGPITITITHVGIKPGTEQPVSIGFEGDNDKPYRPCKSMCRVLVQMWGPDASTYIGRSLTLYSDPAVLWGGMKVGGIRISHMSDINEAHTMALTASKSVRKPFTVKPLTKTQPPARQPVTLADWIANTLPNHLNGCKAPADVEKIVASKQYLAAIEKADAAQAAEMTRLIGATIVKALTDEIHILNTDAAIVAWRISPPVKAAMARLPEDARVVVEGVVEARRVELNEGAHNERA